MRQPEADRSAVVTALERFLAAEPDEWRLLAPRVVEVVGTDRTRRIIDATNDRTGGITSVTDGPDGLVLAGPRGRVPAWARVDDHGRISALHIAGYTHRPPSIRVPFTVRQDISLVLFAVGTWSLAVSGWTEGGVYDWWTNAALTAVLTVLFEGFFAPRWVPWWARAVVEAGLLTSLASVRRLPRLGHGGSADFAILMWAGFLYLSYRLCTARTHTWRAPVSAPLRFPFEEGAWCIGQGGGKATNHHAEVPDQRGALDLVRVTRNGARSGMGHALESYRSYGTRLYAPCDGVVTSALDGVEDQRPGHIRYMPAAGNHVVIDTGREQVLLAHLRPGTLTVTTGDAVRAGDLLGEIGNSGNSTEPHLHIQAARDGLGLDLRFEGVKGGLYRGRVIRPGRRPR